MSAPTALKPATVLLDGGKFRDSNLTADGAPRASVDLRALETLWVNTGTLCNLACDNCYIESSPQNDRLSYIAAAEVAGYLDEIERDALGTREIGFTGGEPFMNPEFMTMLENSLARGYQALVLTNAMKPMWHKRNDLAALNAQYPGQLNVRVSIDHYSETLHQLLRGPNTWGAMLDGLVWLAREGFNLSVAGRTLWQETEAQLRAGFARMFAAHGVSVDSADPHALVLFPEMDEQVDVPEITTGCWDILDVSPASMMCASSRMIVKRRGADAPSVVACTLLPYDPQFELGTSLAEASRRVKLNHPHCARFCVLGGASCSG